MQFVIQSFITEPLLPLSVHVYIYHEIASNNNVINLLNQVRRERIRNFIVNEMQMHFKEIDKNI